MKKVSNYKTAILYAQAMYDAGSKNQALEAMYADARRLAHLSAEGLQEFVELNNPLWSTEDKWKVIAALAEKTGLSESTQNTLKLLAQNRKLNLIGLIAEQFVTLYQTQHNIAEVEVTTAIELSAAQDKLLKSKLAAIFKKEIIVDYIVNPQIIGGLIIKNGTHFIDNSIRCKLNALEQLMKGTK